MGTAGVREMRAGLCGDNSYPAAHVLARGGFWTRHGVTGRRGVLPPRGSPWSEADVGPAQ